MGGVRGKIIRSGDYPSQSVPALLFRSQLKLHPLRSLWISRDLSRSINPVITISLMGLKVYDRLREDLENYDLCCEKSPETSHKSEVRALIPGSKRVIHTLSNSIFLILESFAKVSS